MDLDEICSMNEVPQCALIQKNLGEIAPGVPSKGAKMCFVFFFCETTNMSLAFWPVIMHRFRPFLKEKT